MEYRIEKITYVDDKGNTREKYYPQHRHWWSGWHYFGHEGEYSSRDSFKTLGEAAEFIRIKMKQKSGDRVEHIYPTGGVFDLPPAIGFVHDRYGNGKKQEHKI